MHGIVLHSIVLLRCVLYCVVNLLLGGYNSGAPVAQRAAGTELHRHHGKSKETHEFIFLWLSWLVVLLMSMYTQQQR